MFFLAMLGLVLGVIACCVGLALFDSFDERDIAPWVFCLGLVLILAGVCAGVADYRREVGARAGAWRKLNAQATISAVGGPSWEEFQATEEAESVAWELRAAQAVATAGAPGGGQ